MLGSSPIIIVSPEGNNPKLINYNNFLSYGANFIAVKDFGSRQLMKEVIDLFREYYMLRIPSRREKIDKYMDFFESLFALTEGRLYIKFPWNKLKVVKNGISFG